MPAKKARPVGRLFDVGSTTFGLKSERSLGWAGAGCQGYYNLVEHTAKDSTDRINAPKMFDLIERALGTIPEFGTEFEIEVTVRVKKHGKPSKRKCHNPWAAHRHDKED